MEIDYRKDYDYIFKEVITPFFKEAGFKRQAGNFMRVVNDITQCVNIQKSLYNTRESVQFTFNIGFFSDLIFAIDYDNKPKLKFPKVLDCFLTTRLGMITNGRDYWYEISNDNSPANVKENVIVDFRSHLFQLFNKYDSIKKLEQLYEDEKVNELFYLSNYHKTILLVETNQRDKAVVLINEIYKDAITPKASSFTINNPDGTSKTTYDEPKINQHYLDSVIKLANHYTLPLEINL